MSDSWMHGDHRHTSKPIVDACMLSLASSAAASTFALATSSDLGGWAEFASPLPLAAVAASFLPLLSAAGVARRLIAAASLATGMDHGLAHCRATPEGRLLLWTIVGRASVSAGATWLAWAALACLGYALRERGLAAPACLLGSIVFLGRFMERAPCNWLLPRGSDAELARLARLGAAPRL